MEFIGRFIWQISKNGDTYLDQAFKKYGITSAQFRILRILYRIGGISQEKISKALGIDKSATAKAVKKLINEGYIKRTVVSNDKRMYRLNLSQKAKQIESELLKILTDFQNILIKGFSRKEAKMIYELLCRMVENSNDLFTQSINK